MNIPVTARISKQVAEAARRCGRPARARGCSDCPGYDADYICEYVDAALKLKLLPQIRRCREAHDGR